MPSTHSDYKSVLNDDGDYKTAYGDGTGGASGSLIHLPSSNPDFYNRENPESSRGEEEAILAAQQALLLPAGEKTNIEYSPNFNKPPSSHNSQAQIPLVAQRGNRSDSSVGAQEGSEQFFVVDQMAPPGMIIKGRTLVGANP